MLTNIPRCAATFLMNQAIGVFEKQFPGLEMSPIFIHGHPEFVYKETGMLPSLWPTGAIVEVPIFEKLSDAEEARLGGAGIRKRPVGKLVLMGECQYGCAAVKLLEMKVYKADGTLFWEKPIKK
ncbi:hypothetical protein HDU97_010458 [Phlyctochytrium planicorne]|nr:hypothetical protein HDU97_010458 [Phlyctochytrium planicorne]